jgi:hypothetical protein
MTRVEISHFTIVSLYVRLVLFLIGLFLLSAHLAPDLRNSGNHFGVAQIGVFAFDCVEFVPIEAEEGREGPGGSLRMNILL